METPLWDPISEPAKDLIQRMLTTDVNHRITIQEVLNHKWLRVSRKGKKKRRMTISACDSRAVYHRFAVDEGVVRSRGTSDRVLRGVRQQHPPPMREMIDDAAASSVRSPGGTIAHRDSAL